MKKIISKLDSLRFRPSSYHLRLTTLTLIAYTLGGWFIFNLSPIFNQPPKTEIPTTNAIAGDTKEPFPLGVFPEEKVIIDNNSDNDLKAVFATNHTPSRRFDSLFALIWDEITRQSWYQQLASPTSRTLVIYSGQRAEEITHSFGVILGWSQAEKDYFKEKITSSDPFLADGTFFPGKYQFPKYSSPDQVATEVISRFNREVQSRYTSEIQNIVPLSDILIIAALIEREAYDFTDMRTISGVIWNRLFIDMPLQLDATLQYAKSNPSSGTWWPQPRPADKFIDSPYNTYQNKGLPPTPIANPSIDAIIAALNPRETECLFYFHTDNGSFYCTATYEEHVALLKQHFGRGR